MKKTSMLISLLLVSAMLLTGCNGNEASSDDSTSDKTTSDKSDKSDKSTEDAVVKDYSDPGVFPIVEETVELTVFMPQNVNVTDYVENEFTKYMQDLTNVEVDWMIVPSSDATKKRNLILASNSDLPDVFLGGMDDATAFQYGEQGILLTLNDLIETEMVEFKKVLEVETMVEPLMTSTDGNIYGLPKITDSFGNSYSQAMWINGVWLEELNLEVPQTTDELFTVLKAFKEQDPNGNGIADEIPLVASPSAWDSKLHGFLMMPFIYSDGGDYLAIADDGNLVFAYTQEEWREGLRYIKSLIDEELVDPVSLTQDGTQMKQLVESGDVSTVGSATGGGLSVFTNTAGERIWDYATCVPALEGPEGVKQARFNPYNKISLNQFAITHSCETPEVAIKWADAFYSAEASMKNRYGVPGVDFKYGDDLPADSQDLRGNTPALFEPILPWGAPQASHWQNTGIGYLDASTLDGELTDPDVMTQKRVKWEQFPDTYEQHGVPMIPPLKLTNDESRDVAQLSAVTDAYFEESTARFLIGDLDLDTDWDKYLEELENMQLSVILEMYNKAYSSQWK